MKKWLFAAILVVCLCGSSYAMTERVYYDEANWVGYHVNIADYKAMARDYHHTGNPWVAAFAAREDGTALVSVASNDGSTTFTEQAVVYRNYKALTGIRVNMTHTSGVLGILADSNAVQMVYYNDTAWVATDVNVVGIGVIDDYKSLAFDWSSATSSDLTTFYGARIDGTGVDQINWNGGSWVLNPVKPTTRNYKALCTNYGNGNPSFIGVRADGLGMDQVYYLNGSWTTSPITSADYDAITDVGMGANEFACSKPDGSGVDQVYYLGGWQTSPNVWPEYYKTMAAMNGATNHQFFGSYLCSPRPLLDIDNNCKVDFMDFAAFASEWLDCNKELPADCD